MTLEEQALWHALNERLDRIETKLDRLQELAKILATPINLRAPVTQWIGVKQ